MKQPFVMYSQNDLARLEHLNRSQTYRDSACAIVNTLTHLGCEPAELTLCIKALDRMAHLADHSVQMMDIPTPRQARLNVTNIGE